MTPQFETERTVRSSPRLAVVVPCYNEDLVVPETAARLEAVLDELIAQGELNATSFVYFVDDGSTDETWGKLAALHLSRPARMKALRLARNVGHQTALLAGLLKVKDAVDCAISIDADLQQDEGAIPLFLDKYREGCEVVYGVRTDRLTDSTLKRSTALVFYRLMRLLGVRIVKNHADYRLLSRRAIDQLAEYREVNLFLRGIIAEIGLPSGVVEFAVRPRFAGRSKYSLARMLAFAFDGVTSFSIAPLRFVAGIGALVFVFSVLMTVFVLVSYFAHAQGVVPGWASTLIPIYFLGGVQIMMIGLVGEYIGKIYKEVKARPRFTVESELWSAGIPARNETPVRESKI